MTCCTCPGCILDPLEDTSFPGHWGRQTAQEAALIKVLDTALDVAKPTVPSQTAAVSC